MPMIVAIIEIIAIMSAIVALVSARSAAIACRSAANEVTFGGASCCPRCFCKLNVRFQFVLLWIPLLSVRNPDLYQRATYELHEEAKAASRHSALIDQH